MDGSLQILFNVIVGVVNLLLGWVLKVMWDSVRDLREADSALVTKVGHIEVLVAGEYLKKDEFSASMNRIETALARIFDKLDGKADK